MFILLSVALTMLDFLMQYGLFLAKAVTIFLGVIITLLVVLAAAARNKGEVGAFEIEDINEQITDTRDELEHAILSKEDRKAISKARKKEAKALKKAKSKADVHTPTLYVVYFDGDIKASQVEDLRETVTAIVNVATSKDEVLVVLESGGGFVPHYGLAASQLARFRERKIPLTVAIDKIAASGGYLMACVANKIIAAPFAIVGSIGVVGQLPNFNRLLSKHNVDYEQHTAGDFKRTLTVFGKNDDKARKKFQEELEETHDHFKDFIKQHRPQVDIAQVATGEHWSATKAQGMQLVDEIQTSDDYILAKHPEYRIFEIAFVVKESLKEKLSHAIAGAVEGSILRLARFTENFRMR